MSAERHSGERERFGLHDVYNADEAFVTGTFGRLTRVASVDGREFAPSRGQSLLGQLSTLYDNLIRQ